jgi:hypothetical protein
MGDGSEFIRAWIVDQATVVIDNTEWQYVKVKHAALNAVMGDVGAGPEPDLFLEALRTGETGAYADAIGARVSDLIRSWVTSGLDEAVAELALSVLDLNDTRQHRLLGEHYMPEASDFEEGGRSG